ncbi:MAG: mandelate racemase/muconate lactonizing enzyme family protein [Betaproteobacteria bacterium]|nr:mandelate racemase/muconate lactonizing enzyme family protein [Betaproteobacteria bacterium]NBY06436.1 mandelate racemase/muconate lactonizing enzyme family protein [Betaproteobacteria bacterium]
MKIVEVIDLHANAGWRNVSFLKITADNGLVGWSEFYEGRTTPGLTQVIQKLSKNIINLDPRNISNIRHSLEALLRLTPGGISAQAIAAIENACIDLKAKNLSIPVYELLGGAFRQKLPVYWSHCGTNRVRYEKYLCHGGVPLIRNLDDVVQLGKEVRSKGFSHLKTNIILFDEKFPRVYLAGFSPSEKGFPELNLSAKILDGITDLMSAFQQGAGDDVGLMLDLNYNFTIEGVRKISKALEKFNLTWLEFDNQSPDAVKLIRNNSSTPVASLETIYGSKNFLPFLLSSSVDTAIIDVQWNGIVESIKMAHLAEVHNVNVAAHNYHGYLSSMIGAHFCAAIPNFKVMEFVIDEVSWMKDFFTSSVVFDNQEFVLSDAPGWGCDVNELALKEHPIR